MILNTKISSYFSTFMALVCSICSYLYNLQSFCLCAVLPLWQSKISRFCPFFRRISFPKFPKISFHFSFQFFLNSIVNFVLYCTPDVNWRCTAVFEGTNWRAAKSHGLPVSLQVFALTSRSHGGSWKSHGFH
jgi:hypothetical protein